MTYRALPWIGWAAFALIVVAALGFWYLSAERLRLDEENRRELAHVAHDLETILNLQSSSAKKFFKDKHTPAAVAEFARRNPYVLRDAALPDKIQGDTGSCPELSSPRQLNLGTSQSQILIGLDIHRIFDEVAISDAFEYLFIADGGGTDTGKPGGKGSIVFAMGHGEAARHRDGLGWLDRQAREDSGRDHPVIGLEEVEGLTLDDKEGKALTVAALARTSGTYSVRIGDNRYQLFSYPFVTGKETAPGCKERRHTWIVGGLVDPVRTWREAGTISPQSTLVLALVLLLFFISRPFFKLYWLSPMERFRFADGCMLLPSGVILLMGFTVLLLALGTNQRLKETTADQLETLAGTLETNLTNEFANMRRQLTAYDHQLAQEVRALAREVKAGECQAPKGLPRPDVTGLLRMRPPEFYKDFSQVAWINPAGTQIFKETVHQEGTSRINVKTRPYFAEPAYRPQYLWSFEDRQGPRFFVQSDRSWTTAELQTALSIRSELSLNDVCASDYVAVISGGPVSVERPLLPAGYDFAVITADGQVLYHSDPRHTLKEDFFAEVEDSDKLHAAIQADASLHLTTTYGGRPEELFIRPFDPKGVSPAHWSVVTMRDRRWLDAVGTEALVRTMAWCGLSWLVSLVVALFGFIAGKKILRYWWPNPAEEPFYRALTYAYGALLAAGLIFVAWSESAGRSLFWVSLAFPLVVAVVTLTIYCVVYRGRAPDYSAPYKARWYLAAIAGMWAAVGVVPAAGLFRHSWQLELAKLNGFEMTRYEQRSRDWEAEDREYYRQRGTTFDDLKFFDARTASRTSYRVEYAGISEPTAFDDWLDHILPFYSEPLESIRYQTPQTCEADCQPAGVAFSKLSVALFALVVGLVGWWLWFSTRKLFWTQFVGLPEPAPASANEDLESVWQNCPREEQLTLIQVAQEGFANPRNAVAVESLLRKGLLTLHPSLEFKSEEFRKLAAGHEADVKEWAQTDGGFGWRKARWIFWPLLAVVLGFAAVTGEPWIKSATGLMTALAGGLEALWKVVTSVQRFNSPATP